MEGDNVKHKKDKISAVKSIFSHFVYRLFVCFLLLYLYGLILFFKYGQFAKDELVTVFYYIPIYSGEIAALLILAYFYLLLILRGSKKILKNIILKSHFLVGMGCNRLEFIRIKPKEVKGKIKF
jgi:hypothetical protein